MTSLEIAVVDEDGRLEGGSSSVVVPWWSFTKTLIAVCILRLAEEGRVQLDAPLHRLPYTPRQLLQHRAGVGNYGGLPEYHAAVARGDTPWPDRELFEIIPADRLEYAPGSGWAYSNVGYLLLRRLIERTYGASLRQALQALVLDPLELRASRVAETCEDMRSTAFEGGRNYDPGWAYHGIVVGPASEAALALHRLLNGNVLTGQSRVAMLERYAVGGPIPGRPWQTAGYGLGVMIGAMQRPGMPAPIEVVGHSAGGPGSVGAVYCRLQNDGSRRTVAVFAGSAEEGIAEYHALERLIAT